jgi:mono/diheme cytochrome c family protein
MTRSGQRLKKAFAWAFSGLLLVTWINRTPAQTSGAVPNPQLIYAEQGWSMADRDAFYSTSQGSRLIPYDWYKALRRVDADEPFGADELQRYGYLPYNRNGNNLPVGFVTDDRITPSQLGMTCAACHTGQLEYQKAGVTYQMRLDGAPANADFQLFLTDLAAAARATSTDAKRFDTFARTVLAAKYSAAEAAILKAQFDPWVEQFSEFMDRSLPPSPWGPGRLDAFNMIFNRVAGRGLGLSQNFVVADAPTSYPFLWNASKQDHTQWPGIVENGLNIHGLARNTGEVFGVFGEFSPKGLPTIPPIPPIILYDENSADFVGLQALEEKIAALKPPPWPREVFPLKDGLLAHGMSLFDTNCGGCHAQKDSDLVKDAWATPVQVVGTDPKMAKNAANRLVDSGILSGSLMTKPPGSRLPSRAHATDVLANSVVGSLLAGTLKGNSGVQRAILLDLASLGQSQQHDPIAIQQFLKANLDGLFRKPSTAAEGAYEARVLYGIWATAPYLHNGSVPNLWELLTPPKDRKPSFMVGSRLFDSKNVGYSTEQTPFKTGNFVTDPANANGNGNGGHAYGTTLSEDDRWAIIEYLKTL